MNYTWQAHIKIQYWRRYLARHWLRRLHRTEVTYCVYNAYLDKENDRWKPVRFSGIFYQRLHSTNTRYSEYTPSNTVSNV